MSVEENMALARRFFEARVKTDLDALDKMLAPDFVSYTAAPGQQLDRESYMRHAAESVSAFSDVRFVIEDQVAAGDKVVSRISGRGTHARSEILGTTPTGTEIASIAIFIHRISEGKISEEWGAGTGRSELLAGTSTRKQSLTGEHVSSARVLASLLSCCGVSQPFCRPF